MRVALFVPCYVDQLKPEVGLATLEVLRSVGIEPEYPLDQTCCGQPFLTAGERDSAARLAQRFTQVFGHFDRIVTPSGSCAATVRRHLSRLAPDPTAAAVATATRELCEFLVETDRIPPASVSFPGRVGLHASCHGLRELGEGNPSETREPPRRDPARVLLEGIDGLELIDLSRRDECCGFGGVFAIEQEAVSTRMGLDRLADHRRGGAEVLTSTDVSCLLHLEGLARRREDPLRVLHVAEILAVASGARESPADPRGGRH
jgi:L-lactate dehydrogenase complex protein LldE